MHDQEKPHFLRPLPVGVLDVVGGLEHRSIGQSCLRRNPANAGKNRSHYSMGRFTGDQPVARPGDLGPDCNSESAARVPETVHDKKRMPSASIALNPRTPVESISGAVRGRTLLPSNSAGRGHGQMPFIPEKETNIRPRGFLSPGRSLAGESGTEREGFASLPTDPQDDHPVADGGIPR
jgi:hypothetical protein